MNTNKCCVGHESNTLVPSTNHHHRPTVQRIKAKSANWKHPPHQNNPTLGKTTSLDTPCHRAGVNVHSPVARFCVGVKRAPCWTDCGQNTCAARSPTIVCTVLGRNGNLGPSLSNPPKHAPASRNNTGKYLNAGDCLDAGRQVKQLQRPSMPVGGRRRNRGGGAWPWFATPSLLPAAVVAGKNQSPRDGRKKKARNKCCRLWPSMVVCFLVVMLLVVEVAQAVIVAHNRDQLKDWVDSCLAETPDDGTCPKYAYSFHEGGGIPTWDVSEVTSMENST